MHIRFEYESISETIVLIPEQFEASEWKSFVRIISDYSSNVQEG